ncbi:hypothetical protein [Nocardioides sp. Soil774]|uniref:hypothetical protein n=1 Tax=Nocardioides sp. Soil774 TaxID=1736408 RepID=UPI000A8CE6BE|nr:hypothetical protein [Nocardioides sp. Soil774]
MRGIVRAAVAAVASLGLVSMAPVVTAASAPAPEVHKSAAAFKVIAAIDKTEVVAGEDMVRITGRVRPKAAGQKVFLQQRLDGTTRWKKSGTATIKPSGRFVLKDGPSANHAGVRFYRVLKPAADGVKAATSRELQLDVWAWYDLTSWLSAGAHSGVLLDSYTQFGAEGYSSSLVQETAGTPGYVEYTLGKKVRSLRGTYALTDDSTTGASGSVKVSVDGTAVVTHPLVTGTIVKDYVLDVTNAFRIRFDLVGSATPAGRSAVGEPQVLVLP